MAEILLKCVMLGLLAELVQGELGHSAEISKILEKVLKVWPGFFLLVTYVKLREKNLKKELFTGG